MLGDLQPNNYLITILEALDKFTSVIHICTFIHKTENKQNEPNQSIYLI